MLHIDILDSYCRSVYTLIVFRIVCFSYQMQCLFDHFYEYLRDISYQIIFYY